MQPCSPALHAANRGYPPFCHQHSTPHRTAAASYLAAILRQLAPVVCPHASVARGERRRARVEPREVLRQRGDGRAAVRGGGQLLVTLLCRVEGHLRRHAHVRVWVGERRGGDADEGIQQRWCMHAARREPCPASMQAAVAACMAATAPRGVWMWPRRRMRGRILRLMTTCMQNGDCGCRLSQGFLMYDSLAAPLSPPLTCPKVTMHAGLHHTHTPAGRCPQWAPLVSTRPVTGAEGDVDGRQLVEALQHPSWVLGPLVPDDTPQAPPYQHVQPRLQPHFL